jgi:Photosynthesis system II assembly factor YCF48
MTEVPKIVYDRLRAASLKRALPGQESPELAHPDANVLTAFAEQMLPASEREGVLNHLSVCGDCREAIVLALPAAEIPAKTSAVHATQLPVKAAMGWLSALFTPSLRWAALAAAAAIIAAVLVVRPGNLNETKLTSATPGTAATASDHQTSSATSQSSINESSANPSSMNQSVATLKSERVLPRPQDSASAGKMSGAPVNRGANGRVEVDAAPSAVRVEAPAAPENSLMAQNDEQPVIKAKPAAETEASQLQGTISANTVAQFPLQGRKSISMAPGAAAANQATANNVTWLIKDGVLQRSLDGGHTWRNVMHTDHTLLCYASNEQETWTGGQAGTLFHSADSGLTWVRVQPSIKSQQLSSDITHIELHSRSEIRVSTVNNEMWISADAGKTWEKEVSPDH